jgi:hypothetical protein
MQDLSETKVCPLCAEIIQQKAIVCPHCRHWQKKWSFANPRLQGFCSVAMLLTVWVCASLFLERLFKSEPFGPHLGEISVVSSDYSQKISNSNLVITAIGVLTNSGRLDWKDIGVEVQFFDKSGKMIDVISAQGVYNQIHLLAHSQAGFKVETKAACSLPDYVKHKVFVRWAKEGESLF